MRWIWERESETERMRERERQRERERESERERARERQSERETESERERDRQRDRETERDKEKGREKAIEKFCVYIREMEGGRVKGTEIRKKGREISKGFGCGLSLSTNQILTYLSPRRYHCTKST